MTDRAVALFDEYADAFYSIPRGLDVHGVPDEVRTVQRELVEQGWTFEGLGNARIVFGIPDTLTTTDRELVVKLPLQQSDADGDWWKDGVKQTESEVNMFYEAHVDTTYLTPIRAYDDTCKWVVMERVDEFDPNETDLETTATLEHRLESSHLQPGDFHTGNLGWLPVDETDPADPLIDDGRRLVMLDYGMLSNAGLA